MSRFRWWCRRSLHLLKASKKIQLSELGWPDRTESSPSDTFTSRAHSHEFLIIIILQSYSIFLRWCNFTSLSLFANYFTTQWTTFACIFLYNQNRTLLLCYKIAVDWTSDNRTSALRRPDPRDLNVNSTACTLILPLVVGLSGRLWVACSWWRRHQQQHHHQRSRKKPLATIWREGLAKAERQRVDSGCESVWY